MNARPTVLLVDDEPFNLDYLEQELEDLGLEIRTATNGQDALAIIAQDHPDMIFLDVMMPEMDGFQVLSRIKTDPQLESIPVVIISAASDLSSIAKGIELGAEDFLPKPFEPVLLHARLNAGLEKKRMRDLERQYLQSLERELEIGHEIQTGFLPAQIPQPIGWEIEAFFCPAREVAGDFYDIFEMGDGQLGVLIGDVTDKGVGSALYMALFRSLLRVITTMETCTNPGEADLSPPERRIWQAVTIVNDYICNVHDSAMFASLFFGALDPQRGQFCYINAGHDRPYFVKQSRQLIEIDPTGPLIGAFPDASYEIETLQLGHGEALVLYSDGVPDARNSNGEMFQQDRWREVVLRLIPDSNRCIEDLRAAVMDFIGSAPQADDITLLTIKRH